ncbi:MAG: hypothetical protein DRP15_03160 [Candidatus Aenigmatarchaeota archaeon]|nr:MAG: hypothetical protein DRP15_03160 [Candidatus Aenigmarchaeota archaeon]
MVNAAKVPTGIPGFDKLINGGFEPYSINLITGKTGTGKSIFCTQFLYNGVVMYGEKGLYVTTEEHPDFIRRQAAAVGMNLQDLQKKGYITIVGLEPFEVDLLTTKTSEFISSTGAKRVVIDSVSMFELYINDPFKIRKALFKFLQNIRQMGVTVLVTAEVLEESNALSRFGVIEFLVDSVIVLQYMSIAKYKRSLMIRKMRISDHSTNIHPFEITNKGIVVRSI